MGIQQFEDPVGRSKGLLKVQMHAGELSHRFIQSKERGHKNDKGADGKASIDLIVGIKEKGDEGNITDEFHQG